MKAAWVNASPPFVFLWPRFKTNALLDGAADAAAVAGAKKASDVLLIVKTPRTDLIGMTPSLLTGAGLAAGLALASLLWLLAPRSVRSAA